MPRFPRFLSPLLLLSILATLSCAPRDGIRPAAHGPVASLIDLQDPDLIASSRTLAAEAIRRSQFFDQRLDIISDRLLSRELDEGERTYLTGPRDQAMTFYKAHPAAARELVGPALTDSSTDPADLATWTIIASQIPSIEKHIAGGATSQ